MRRSMLLTLSFLAVLGNLCYGQQTVPQATPAAKHSKHNTKMKKQEPPPVVKYLPPIEFKKVSSGPGWRMGYFYGDKELRSNRDFEDVIDPYGDTETSHWLRSSDDKALAGTVELPLGILMTAGGLFFTLTDGPKTLAPAVNNEFFSAPAVVAQPDLTLSLSAVGVGLVSIIGGIITLDDSGNEKRRAVARYNHLVETAPQTLVTSAGAENAPSHGPAAEEPGEASTPTAGSAPVSMAAAPVSAPIPHDFAISLSPLVNFPFSANAFRQYFPAFGFDLNVEFPLDKNLSLGLESGFQQFPVNQVAIAGPFEQDTGQPLPYGSTFAGGWNYLPLFALVKFSLPDDKFAITPYIFVGAGAAFNWVTYTATPNSTTVSTAETDLLETQGIGLGVRVAPGVELFTQCRLDLDFTGQNNSDTVTVTNSSGESATGKGYISGDNPTVFMPLQVGVRFWQ
jgi:hypothetical protein